MPTYADWLAKLPIKHNRTGVRLDLRLYVYPDGHGNLVYTDPDGNQPVNGVEEAMEKLRAVWQEATQASRDRSA